MGPPLGTADRHPVKENKIFTDSSMYYVAKVLQFFGLAIIGLAFVAKFPSLMDPKLFAVGIVIGYAGWVIQRYLLKR